MDDPATMTTPGLVRALSVIDAIYGVPPRPPEGAWKRRLERDRNRLLRELDRRHRAPSIPVDPALVGRPCDEEGCSRDVREDDDADFWQSLHDGEVLLCDDHKVCATCGGDGYLVDGDRERPCHDCSLPYPEW